MTIMANRKRTRRPRPSLGRTCSICMLPFPVCRQRYQLDHEFLSMTAARAARATGSPLSPEAAQALEDARNALHRPEEDQ